MSSHRDEETIIENYDWNQLSLEQLKLLQSKISQAINLKIRDLKLTQSTANLSKVHRYKASLSKVYPARLRSSLSDYQKCVFITSLGSKNFVDSKRLEASIKWISEHFKACVVVVGDSYYRLTIGVRQGLKGDEAWLEAIRTGETFINENRFLFQQYSGSCQFQFQMASQIEKQSEFEMYYKDLQCLYQKDESFQRMVNSFAQTYLNRGEQAEEEQVEELLQRQKHLAITYLLEESAVFTCLGKEGWPVFVYPGSIKTFEEIAEGLHPEVPLPLKQMIWVSLRLDKKATAG
ncbi:tRNA-dependent cyclodipeptide synthase [Moorena sp. SIO4G3]|uniref:tRNA-dependent cyclodipeptide synthase n=1 Tax=Moorena sp. SIO4G3 TaxID=2607821 RepID=UPI00142B596B|nr:tRNA-dependent cyclodipeptide synthase [Moorena sp. SIO4G3]NEO76597.1 tRNA-dependent cyclodipeptide synthase [Moorena sp. SIO4G3]